ncbi:MAG: DUF4232 domain-containing protein [Streptosporangiaceae bacterium]
MTSAAPIPAAWIRSRRAGLVARRAGLVARSAAAAALVLLAAACGSGGRAQPAAAGRPAGTSAGSCGGTGLRVVLDDAAAGAAAGSSFVPIDFTNTTRSRCHLSGYPAVALAASAAGSQIGVAAAPDRSRPARTVLLAPGGSAHAWLQVGDAMNYPAAQCRPVTARGLRVSLPGESGEHFLAHVFVACTKTPAHGRLLIIEPIERGTARRGTAG